MTAPPPDEERIELGAKIRALRTEAGLTIAALASAADISQSLVSQVERGLAEPSLTTLRRVASALNTTIGALFVGGPETQRSAEGLREWQLIVRRGDRKHLRMPGSDISYELLVPDLARKLEVITTDLPAGTRVPPEPSLHAGEETVLCLEGEVVAVYGDENLRLEHGDAISWDPSLPHWIENRSRRRASILAIITPPNF